MGFLKPNSPPPVVQVGTFTQGAMGQGRGGPGSMSSQTLRLQAQIPQKSQPLPLPAPRCPGASHITASPAQKAWDAAGMLGPAQWHQSCVAGREQLRGEGEEQTSPVKFPCGSGGRSDASEQDHPPPGHPPATGPAGHRREAEAIRWSQTEDSPGNQPLSL